MSGSSIYSYVAGTKSFPGYLVFENKIIYLAKFSVIRIGACFTGKANSNKQRSSQTLATRLNQLNSDNFEGTSSCELRNWIKTQGNQFRLLNILYKYWLLSASAKLNLNLATWLNIWSKANPDSTCQNFKLLFLYDSHPRTQRYTLHLNSAALNTSPPQTSTPNSTQNLPARAIDLWLRPQPQRFPQEIPPQN